jgi:hypothetical protein
MRSRPRSEYWPGEVSIRLWMGERVSMFERNVILDLRTLDDTPHSNQGSEWAAFDSRVKSFCSVALATSRKARGSWSAIHRAVYKCSNV